MDILFYTRTMKKPKMLQIVGEDQVREYLLLDLSQNNIVVFNF